VGAVGSERRIVNVAAGNIAAGSTDAVNGGQLYAANLAAGTAQATADTALARTAYIAATGSGTAPVASGSNAVAIGNAAVATQANAVAIGNGATTTRANQVALGGAGGSVRVGDIAASTAAQSGPTDIATVDADGTLGRDTSIRPAIASLQATNTAQDSAIAAIQTLDTQQNGRLTTLEAAQSSLSGRVETVNRDANGGIAAAMALGGTVLPADSHFAISFDLATYRGQQGFAGSAVLKASDHVYLSAGVAGSTVKDSTGGRVGVTFAW